MQYLNTIYITPLLFGRNSNAIKRPFVLQKKSLRIIYFLNHNVRTSPLFRDLNILKLSAKIALENCLFINKYFRKCLPQSLKIGFLSHLIFIPTILAGPNHPITLNYMEGTHLKLALFTHGII